MTETAPVHVLPAPKPAYNRFQFHDPAVGPPAVFTAAAALLAHPVLAQRASVPGFVRFSVRGHDDGKATLYAEYDGGTRWDAVGYLAHSVGLGLPDFGRKTPVAKADPDPLRQARGVLADARRKYLHRPLVHFRGSVYRVVAVSLREHDFEVLLTYAQLPGRGADVWTRPLAEAEELVPWPDGATRPRLTVGDGSI